MDDPEQIHNGNQSAKLGNDAGQAVALVGIMAAVVIGMIYVAAFGYIRAAIACGIGAPIAYL